MEFKKLDEIQKRILMEVADLHSVPEGAFNIRPISTSSPKRTGPESTSASSRERRTRACTFP